MRVLSVLCFLALAACTPKSTPVEPIVEVADEASDSVLSPGETIDMRTTCSGVDSYRDLVEISYFQYVIYQNTSEIVLEKEVEMVELVVDLYAKRLLMYEPELPDEAAADVDDAVKEFQRRIDVFVSHLDGEIDGQLARAKHWEELHDNGETVDRLWAEATCREVLHEVDDFVDDFRVNYYEIVTPLLRVVEKHNLSARGLEEREFPEPFMIPDFGEPLPPLPELE